MKAKVEVAEHIVRYLLEILQLLNFSLIWQANADLK